MFKVGIGKFGNIDFDSFYTKNKNPTKWVLSSA